MKIPIVLMAFARPDLLKLCMRQLSKFQPPILYIMGDGPRNKNEKLLCNESRKIAENPTWNCKIIRIYKNKNQGIVKSFIESMSRMFEDHEFGIYLEDDILLSDSFYPFCQSIHQKYKNNESVGHVNATNVFPDFKTQHNESYIFSNNVTEWGFATWKRVWKKFDIKMPDWEKADQNMILKKVAFNMRSRKSLKAMFDLHSNNNSPLAWGYQWQYNCLRSNLLTITPSTNMSLNLGFERDDSTNTFGINPVASELKSIKFPLSHPTKIKCNRKFDKLVESKLAPSHFKILISKLSKRIILKAL